VPSGRALWTRKGIPYPASLRFSNHGDCVSWKLDNRQAQLADALTGQIVETYQDRKQQFDGPNGHALIVPLSGAKYLIGGPKYTSIPRLTFAILDVAFGTDTLCVTESGGPVRCVDGTSGIEKWRYEPPEGSHVLKLYFDDIAECCYGVLWHYEKGQFRHLIRLNAKTGRATHLRDLTSFAEAFAPATRQLVTSAGELIDLSNGQLVGKLEFPK
jgi:hypothetical protein